MEDYTRARGAWKVGEDVTFTVRRGSLTHETSVKIAANATSETSYEIPAVIRYRNRPSDCDLSILLGGLLFNYHSCFDLKVRETEPPAAERTSRRKWGAVLDLLEYERRSNGRKHVRLLWLIPIYWGGD
jgi:hypothetical protein